MREGALGRPVRLDGHCAGMHDPPGRAGIVCEEALRLAVPHGMQHLQELRLAAKIMYEPGHIVGMQSRQQPLQRFRVFLSEILQEDMASSARNTQQRSRCARGVFKCRFGNGPGQVRDRSVEIGQG